MNTNIGKAKGKCAVSKLPMCPKRSKKLRHGQTLRESFSATRNMTTRKASMENGSSAVFEGCEFITPLQLLKNMTVIREGASSWNRKVQDEYSLRRGGAMLSRIAEAYSKFHGREPERCGDLEIDEREIWEEAKKGIILNRAYISMMRVYPRTYIPNFVTCSRRKKRKRSTMEATSRGDELLTDYRPSVPWPVFLDQALKAATDTSYPEVDPRLIPQHAEDLASVDGFSLHEVAAGMY
eukprot:gb/GECG01007874.1/.p1 GENE.gb/GECG01007874.1/~~gb/GECG01007874.1/.p1  ORF type:complete len:238 (+),score=27.83 gb/GECG01007874.1/:1-714(+)